MCCDSRIIYILKYKQTKHIFLNPFVSPNIARAYQCCRWLNINQTIPGVFLKLPGVLTSKKLNNNYSQIKKQIISCSNKLT